MTTPRVPAPTPTYVYPPDPDPVGGSPARKPIANPRCQFMCTCAWRARRRRQPGYAQNQTLNPRPPLRMHGRRGFGTTYKSQPNLILSASLILAIDLWDFGCAGLGTVRTVRIGLGTGTGAHAYRCVVGICAGANSSFGGYFRIAGGRLRCVLLRLLVFQERPGPMSTKFLPECSLAIGSKYIGVMMSLSHVTSFNIR